MSRLRWILAALVAASSTLVFGQAVNFGQIHGRVTDPSGAAVADARISATQTATGTQRTTTTNAEGAYSLPSLPVGPYALSVRAQGFRQYEQKGIVLQVGEDDQIDVKMTIGAALESVEVTADAATVETRETSVSDIIDQRQVVDLPLDGRQLTQLILITGAAANPTLANQDLLSTKNYANGTGDSSVTISVAGGQQNANNYLLDGGDHIDSFSNVNLPFPFPDATQEYSVQRSTLSARYGVHSGAVVNIVTKSGTNKWHGDVFEYIRNSAVNARRPIFDSSAASLQDTLKRNQFGGTVGGPVITNKLHFFAGYQGTRKRQTLPASQVIVPTAQILSGDFSTIESTTCQRTAKQLRDPATGQNLAGNRINPARFTSQATKLLQVVPTSANPCGILSFTQPNIADEDQGISRVDWSISPSQTLFGRYFIADFRSPPFFDGKNALTTTTAGQLSRTQSLALGHTWTLSNDLVNSVHVTGTRLGIFRGPAADMINPSALGVNIPAPVPNDLVVSVTGYFNIEGGTQTAGHFNSTAYQAANDVDWVKGHHQMAFGVNYIHNILNELSTFQTNGQFTFSGALSNDALLDLLLGLPNSFTQGNDEHENWYQNYYGFYFQDSWRVRPNLTLSGGIRWEPYLPAVDRFHRGSHFDLNAFRAGTRSTVFPTAPPGLFYCGDSQTPCEYVNGKMNMFSPRFGFNWDPRGSGKQTIRAGYGIFRENPEIFYFDRFADNSPFGSAVTITRPAGGFANPYQGQTVPVFPSPWPVTAQNAFFPANGVYINSPLDIKPTYVQQWNLALEQQAGAWLLSAAYMGNKTSHIWVAQEGNPSLFIPGQCSTTATAVSSVCTTTAAARRLLSQINATNGAFIASLTEANDGADANYHGMLLTAKHRFSRNYSVTANYTWSHCISDADFTGELTNSRPIAQTGNLAAERGNCGFDIRHIFNTAIIAATPQFQNRWLRLFATGWQASTIVSYHTGSYFSILSGNDWSASNIGRDRADQIGDPNAGTCTNGAAVHSVTCWFNTSAYVHNAPGTYGTSGRNSVVGPGLATVNAGVARRFRVTESQSMEVRFEAFNALNHTNLRNPTATLSNNKFGAIDAAGDPRILQLAVKYVF